jgi:single-strand DNA-binding protein
MVSGFNKVILVGNLTADPEIRYTPDGTPVANFRIASNRRWRGKDGTVNEDTFFGRVVVWRRQAENCAQYLGKGRPVIVEGRLQTREFTDKEGQRRWITEIVADRVVFLPGGRPGDEETADETGGHADDTGGGSHPDETTYDDDLPFA